MNFKLSINDKLINKGSPTQRGWVNADFDAEQLITHINTGYAFGPGVLNSSATDKKPAVADIDFAELLAIDIDNDLKAWNPDAKKYDERRKEPEEGYLTFDIALADPWLHDNALLIYTTPSHTLEWHRFRIVFLLPEPVLSPSEYSKIVSVFIQKFGGDTACRDISRLFFGNTFAESVVFNKRLSKETLGSLMLSAKAEKNEVTKYEKTKESFELTADDVATMLNYIPRKMDYNEWGKVVSAIGNYFDRSTAISLIENWSPDTKMGTAYRIDKRSKTVSIGSVIHIASLYGFDKNTLYKRSSPINRRGRNELQPRSTSYVSETGEVITETQSVQSSSFVQTIKNYLNERFDFRFNTIKSWVEFRAKNETEFTQLVDREVNEIWCELQQLYGKGITIQAVENIINSKFAPDFDAINHYFNHLPEWDGHDYINDFANLITVSEGQQDYWKIYLYKWLTAAVACGLGVSINHTCIVLVGAQGKGKTTIIKRLMPPELLPYFASAQINPKDKDGKILLSEMFVINLDELESSTRDEIGHLKSLMTESQITARRPYGRRVETSKRRASFIGSVNRPQFLTDLTGTRRFLCVDIVDIDLDTPFNVDQLWAQALHFLRSEAFPYWFEEKEIEEINLRNKAYMLINPEEEIIAKHFRPYELANSLSVDELKHKADCGVIKLLTCTDIFDVIQQKTHNRISIHKLGMILKTMGYFQRCIRFGDDVKKVYALNELIVVDDVKF